MDKKNKSYLSQNKLGKSKNIKIAKQYLEKIFASLPGRAYIKDRQGVYLMCNEELARDCGFSSTWDIIGKTDFDLPSKAHADVLRKVDYQVMANEEPFFRRTRDSR